VGGAGPVAVDDVGDVAVELADVPLERLGPLGVGAAPADAGEGAELVAAGSAPDPVLLVAVDRPFEAGLEDGAGGADGFGLAAMVVLVGDALRKPVVDRRGGAGGERFPARARLANHLDVVHRSVTIARPVTRGSLANVLEP
jgi:hypothetical protein